jgi:tetratricopeptide (TPR) repeat protein
LSKLAASLCFRVNIPNLSLRILGSYKGGKRGLATTLSESELTEYSIALSRIGAIPEAQLWLGTLPNDNSIAKTLLYKAYIHIMQWQYTESLTYLRQYIERVDITDYERLIAKNHIVAAHVFEDQLESAEKVLSQLRLETRKANHNLLLSNCLELSAQVERAMGNFNMAQSYLDKGFEARCGMPRCSSKKSRGIKRVGDHSRM